MRFFHKASRSRSIKMATWSFFICLICVHQVFTLKCYISNTNAPSDPLRLLDCTDPQLTSLTTVVFTKDEEVSCYKLTPEKTTEQTIHGCLKRNDCPEIEKKINAGKEHKMKCTECYSDSCNSGASGRVVVGLATAILVAVVHFI